MVISFKQAQLALSVLCDYAVNCILRTGLVFIGAFYYCEVVNILVLVLIYSLAIVEDGLPNFHGKTSSPIETVPSCICWRACICLERNVGAHCGWRGAWFGGRPGWTGIWNKKKLVNWQAILRYWCFAKFCRNNA